MEHDVRTHSAHPTFDQPGDEPAAHTAEDRDAEAAMSGEDSELRDAIIDALKQCYDPEIPVDIYELGLIYSIDLDESNRAMIKMTLTSPMCPVAESLPGEVQQRVAAVAGVAGAEIDLVWEPAWNPSMMSEAAKLQLGF